MIVLIIFMLSDFKKGFTLIELLVVIAIIGILAAVVLASLNDSREQAKQRKAQQEMRSIHTAMELMYSETGSYLHGENRYCPPISDDGNEIEITTTNMPQLSDDVLDPWGNYYWFDEDYYCTAGALGCNGQESNDVTEIFSVIVSCGPDGMMGDDPSNSQPTNGLGCAYNDDNIVYAFCSS